MLTSAYAELQGRHGGVAGVIVAANSDVAAIVRKRIRVFPNGLHMVTADTDATIAWADICLAVSGTITLDIRGDEFLVHALTDHTADGVIDGEMDRRVTELEGLA